MILKYNQEKELELKITFEKYLKEPCPFCPPLGTGGIVFAKQRLSLYSYGDQLDGIRYLKEFYKIICTNCGITSGIQFGLDETVKSFFKACMKRYSLIELVKEAGNDN